VIVVVKVQQQASGMNNQGFKIAILHFKDRTKNPTKFMFPINKPKKTGRACC
jgi:hypothetical protein